MKIAVSCSFNLALAAMVDGFTAFSRAPLRHGRSMTFLGSASSPSNTPPLRQGRSMTFLSSASAPSNAPHEKTSQELAFLEQSLTFSDIFNGIAPAEIEKLVEAFEPITFEKGAHITNQGFRNEYFYVIESGDVQFAVDGKPVGTEGASQCFGELGVGAATATAYGGDTKLWRVDRATFKQAMGSKVVPSVETYSERVKLKKALEEASITSFDDHTPCMTCESIMGKLEEFRPIARPAYHPSMNGDWCMVRASANTLDMTLITILSTISRFFPFVDFKDCYITLSDNASMVKCHIYLTLFGSIPFKMNTFTKLENDDSHPDGALIYESFQGYKILGFDLPLPDVLKQASRPLLITYLDEDIMIARNSLDHSGQPHLLVRIRACPESDPDHEFTGFFEDARQLYGDRITRCLVDRYFGHETENEHLRKALEKAKSLSVSNTRERLQLAD